MSSFLKYLTQPEPEGNCLTCGQNRYGCTCDDTPAVDIAPMIEMYHIMSHKRMAVEKFSDKYFVMCSQNWVELK